MRVGLFDKLLPSRQAVGLLLARPDQPAIRSPWTESNLARVALADITGMQVPGVSRLEAMGVPAVARGRGLIVGHLSALPLKLWDAAAGVEVQAPAWFGSTRTLQSPRMRLAWTFDDLIFTGMSLWACERDAAGGIVDAIRVPRNQWRPDPDTLGVEVNGQAVTDPASVILFEGLQEGLLTIAAGDIRGALDMSSAWRKRVKSPIPNVALTQTEQNVELEDDEIDQLILDWEAAREASGTAFVPWGIKADAMGDVKTELFTDGRNGSRLDLANYLQVPASLLEGSQSTATLTYSTQEGRRSDFLDSCLTYWAAPIEARLSQDDITPDGSTVRFDYSSLATPTQPAHTNTTED